MEKPPPLYVQVAIAIGREIPEDHDGDEAPEGRKQCVRCGSSGN